MHLHLVARKWLLSWCTRLCVHQTQCSNRTAEECAVSRHSVSNEKSMKLQSNATSLVFF